MIECVAIGQLLSHQDSGRLMAQGGIQGLAPAGNLADHSDAAALQQGLDSKSANRTGVNDKKRD